MKPSLLTAVIASTFSIAAVAEIKPMSTVPAKPADQVTLSNYTEHPYNHWSFQNMGIHPVVMVPRDGAISEIPLNLSPEVVEHKFKYGENEYTFRDAMINDFTDGYIIIKDGKVLHEEYFGDFGHRDKHLWASSTKSLVGQALGLLVEQGKVDVNEKVSKYVTELAGTHFGEQSLHTVLNMTSALNYREDYVNMAPGEVHYEYFRRLGFVPAYDLMAIDPTKDDTPRDLLSFAGMFEQAEGLPINNTFEYHSPNVDVIGWVIARVSGQPLNEFIADNIWNKLGAEHDAFFMADIGYNPIATGGFNTTLRDFARVGLAMVNNGQYNGEQVFSEKWVKDSFNVDEQDRKATNNSIYKQKEGAVYDSHLEGYKNFLWVHDSEKNIATYRGVFGQFLYINQDKNVVIATFSSADSASNAARETSKIRLEAFESLAQSL
ncbi:beta-lactamase family protein [Vibrio sp. D404a]|uniref:serine hydrolase domain-containing protein n=1 Tax=unclassified Vibrio TaxID=2614977 RepID=UPI00255250C8|nr:MULTISPECIES: serine hydrolase [unclassified Vibrio]MDK9735753.1 beta-lactamase family protein [Vibrio sp. D404a]MDK9798669.1 beta-lactamase family protein [Vibrio sp. D449a]